MTRALLDINALLALLDSKHVFHDAAHRWVESTADLVFLTCPLVQNGTLRVASQAGYPNRLGTTAEARRILQAFCADPRHEFCPDDLSLLDEDQVARPEVLTPSRVTDVYLLALARKHGARLATFDRRVPVEAVPDGRKSLLLIEA